VMSQVCKNFRRLLLLSGFSFMATQKHAAGCPGIQVTKKPPDRNL